MTSVNCKGRGIAKKCETEGGEMADFTDYILNLWSSIGYSPAQSVEVADNFDQDSIKQFVEEFTPVKYHEEPSRYAGVLIKQVPKISILVKF